MKNFSAEIPAYLPNGFFWIKAVFSDFMLLEDRFLFSKHGPAHSALMQKTGQKLTIPCHYGGGKTPIAQVKIVKEEKWQNKHWGNINSNYSHLPFFNYLAPEVEPLFQQQYYSVNDLHFSIINYIKYMWRLPVKFQLASKEFGSKLPELYVEQWHDNYQFDNYLIFPYEKKYILPKAGEIKWNFSTLHNNNKDFENKFANDVLYLLFFYGTDFPGLVKKHVSLM